MQRILWLTLALMILVPQAVAGGLEIGPNHTGLAIGNVPEFRGLRLNFSDRDLVRVDGVNFTIWRAHGGEASGRVNGLALGVVAAEADELRGIAIGGLGVGAETSVSGLAVGLLGVGAGDRATGIIIGGLGAGVGEDLRGLAIGGLGMGVGESFRGIGIGGLGMGVGEDATGLILAGLGAGIGGSFRGIGASMLGFGIGEDASGLLASGLGFGVGGDLRGIAVGGLGMGVGGQLTGLGVGGLGMGVSESRGILLATAYIRGHEMRGLSVSAYNRFEDSMEGVAIGIVNITHELHGVQLGLLNIAWDNPRGRRVLPIVNWGG